MKTLSILAICIALAPLGYAVESSPLEPNADGKINLVAVGEGIYLQHCFICHEKLPVSDPKSLPKIGPTFFGLLQKTPIKKKVFSKETLAETLTEIVIDDHYIRSSLLDPTLHFATKEDCGKYTAYPPGMPRFPLEGPEFKGVSAFLRTLNDEANRGPEELWVDAPKVKSNNDKFEVRVGLKTKIVRAIFGDVSTRAIAVGSPVGIHYLFDPSTLSIRKVWKGGFLNLKSESTGRNKGLNLLGKDAEVMNYGYAIRPLAEMSPVDLSFQSFPTDGLSTYARIEADLGDPTPYLDRIPKQANYLGYRLDQQGNPEFHYQIGDTEYRQKVEFSGPKTMKLKLTFSGGTEPILFQIDADHVRLDPSEGTLDGNILSIPAATKSATLTLNLIK